MSRSCFLFAAASGLALTAGAAGAQEATTVGEIVVTAAPFAVSIDSTTTHVDVLSQEDLARAPAAGLGAVLDGLPGVRSTAYGPGASRPIIRGQSGARVMVLQNGVGLVDASALSPDHAVAADPGQASRIEVVRGPSALAYGGSAIGGVVNVIDDRIPDAAPDGGYEGQATASYNSADRAAAASFGARFGRGPWVLAVDGERRTSDDYRTATTPISTALAADEGLSPDPARRQRNTDTDLTAYGLGVSRLLTDGYVGVSVRRTESAYGIPYPQELGGLAGEGPIGIDLQQTRIDARGESAIQLPAFERVRFSAGYADYQHAEIDRSAGGVIGTQFFSTGAEGRLELIQRDRNGWQGAVGIQGLSRNFEALGDEAFIPPVDIRETGAFVLQRLDRGGWGIEGGARIDTRDLTADLAGRKTSLIADSYGLDWSTARSDPAFHNTSLSAGVFARPAEGWFVSLSASRNARAPTEFELFSDGPHEGTESYQVGDPTLRPEVVTSYEATVRRRADRFRAEGHLFHARYDGYIDERPTGDVVSDEGDPADPELPVYRFVQTDATFEGGELEVGFELLRRSEGSLWLEAMTDRVSGSTPAGPPARIPPPSYLLRVSWEGERLDLSAQWRRVEGQDRLAPLERATGGYDTLDLSAGFRPLADKDVTIFVDATNLTNATVREHTSYLKDIAPAAGRSIRLGVTARY